MSTLQRGRGAGSAANLIKLGKLDGVSVRVHWTVVAGCVVLAAVSVPLVLTPLCGIAAYFTAMLLHEWGHTYVARRCRCRVYRIELYPFMGLTHFSTPYSHRDHSVIAWGGIGAQALVAVPLLLFMATVGDTPFAPLNVFITTLAWLCVSMILLNLLPIPPLDGALAWSRLPPVPRIRWGRRMRRQRKTRGWNALAGRGSAKR